jgi:hypothetical protein
MARIDLTDWIIHFVHNRVPENDPRCFCSYPEAGEDFEYADYFDSAGQSQRILDTYADDDFPIEDDAPAFVVLKKILHDGYIKSGWSFRSGKPTIYGPTSAVCFTEMPLYALIDYAKKRGSYSDYVGEYGIAFKRGELYNAGARPVIYGLSTKHIEALGTDPFWNIGSAYRLLSTTETGIGPVEQYRYVSMNLSGENRIDWSHEREWRWPLVDDQYGVPGLPFLLSEDYADFFSEVIVIVSTEAEKTEILRRLKNMYDSEGTQTGFAYNTELIKNTKVLSIEALCKLSIDTSKIRLEDIPMSNFSHMKEIVVRPEILERVKKAWEGANEIAYKASQNFLSTNMDGKDKGPAGFSDVSTFEISEITQAFVNLGIASSYSNDRYILWGLKQCAVQSVDVHETGAKAASEFLTKELGQNFYPYSRLD